MRDDLITTEERRDWNAAKMEKRRFENRCNIEKINQITLTKLNLGASVSQKLICSPNEFLVSLCTEKSVKRKYYVVFEKDKASLFISEMCVSLQLDSTMAPVEKEQNKISHERVIIRNCKLFEVADKRCMGG